MSDPMVAAPLKGKILGTSDNSFAIAEWRDDGSHPGRPIAPLHLHRSDDEAWYVLEGTLCVRSGDQIINAKAGSGVLVPRGTPHTYWNPSPEPARYLLFMTPTIYRLIQAIHATDDRTPSSMNALFGKYDSELLG